MADNAVLNAGSGGITLATDDIAGVHYQIVKVSFGALDTATPVSGANPMPVVQTGTHTVTGAGGTFPITAVVGAPAFVQLSDGAAAITTLPVSLASVPSHAVTNAGTFAVQAAQSGTWNIGSITTLPALVAGTANIGDVDVLTVPADPFGANADAASATGSISAKLRFIAATGIPVTGTVTLAANSSVNIAQVVGTATAVNNGTASAGCQRVTIASDNTAFNIISAGTAAHDAAIAGNPVRIGARALSADFTAVTTGDAVDIAASLLGKQIVLPYALPAASWNYAAASGGIVNTTGVTAKAAGAAGVRNYITHVDVVNGHATVDTDVQIRDGAAGTVLWRGFAKAAGGGVSSDFNPPLRGTAATLVEVACGTTGTATYFNLTGFTAAE